MAMSKDEYLRRREESRRQQEAENTPAAKLAYFLEQFLPYAVGKIEKAFQNSATGNPYSSITFGDGYSGDPFSEGGLTVNISFEREHGAPAVGKSRGPAGGSIRQFITNGEGYLNVPEAYFLKALEELKKRYPEFDLTARIYLHHNGRRTDTWDVTLIAEEYNI